MRTNREVKEGTRAFMEATATHCVFAGLVFGFVAALIKVITLDLHPLIALPLFCLIWLVAAVFFSFISALVAGLLFNFIEFKRVSKRK